MVAIDVDGTLLRTDGTIAIEDRQAIAAARERGITVTLATGRLSSSTLPVARMLDLDDPLVCADGAVLYCPRRLMPLDLQPLAASEVSAMRAYLARQSLAPFVFTHETVFGAAADGGRFPFIAGWTPNIVACEDLSTAPTSVITAIGVGLEHAAMAAETELRADSRMAGDISVFPIRGTDHWVVRLTPTGCSKATGLARLAGRLGMVSAEVAVIGDWYNDLAMFAWAGWSFAMGNAPGDVKRAARRALTATSSTGGGVAEALAHMGVV